MAIEFQCPYCSAAIRVQDAHSGKKGSCPKCSQKLLVPDIVPPKTAESSSAESTIAQTQTAIPPVGSPLPASMPPQSGPPPLVSDSPPASNGLPQLTPPAPAQPSISRKLKRKTRRKKSQGLYTWGIPIVCLMLFFSVVALLMSQLEPELKGTLKGNVAIAMELPTATVSWSSFDLTGPEAEDAKSAFSLKESFISSQMACRIGAQSGSGLDVDFEIGEEFSWYVVNPINDLVLSDWIRDNQQRLNARRLQELTRAGTELCRDKIKKAAGQSVIFAAEVYRDNFGVNTHVEAFGSVVEAIAQNRGSVCFHEDSNGTLYFALPKGTTRFVLRGRKFGGQSLFPGEYTVVVDSVPVESDATVDTGKFESEPDPETGDQPMDSNGMQ